MISKVSSQKKLPFEVLQGFIDMRIADIMIDLEELIEIFFLNEPFKSLDW